MRPRMTSRDAGRWMRRAATAIAMMGVCASHACIMHQYRTVSSAPPSALVGHTVKLAFAAESLTVRVERVDGRAVIGRVIEGSGPVAIVLDEVRAARLESLSTAGRVRNLRVEQLRADPTIVDGGNVVFTTTSGDVLLRGVHVLPEGWLGGTVVPHVPVESAVEVRGSDIAQRAGLVRINLDDARTIAIRETNTNKTIILTAALIVTVGFLAFLSAAAAGLRGFHIGLPTLS